MQLVDPTDSDSFVTLFLFPRVEGIPIYTEEPASVAELELPTSGQCGDPVQYSCGAGQGKGDPRDASPRETPPTLALGLKKASGEGAKEPGSPGSQRKGTEADRFVHEA